MIVRSAVGSVTDTVVSKSLAVEPSKTILPLAIEIALAASATPETRVVEDKEVKPAIVEPVAPKAIAVLPIVISSFANCPLGIALVPISPDE